MLRSVTFRQQGLLRSAALLSRSSTPTASNVAARHLRSSMMPAMARANIATEEFPGPEGIRRSFVTHRRLMASLPASFPITTTLEQADEEAREALKLQTEETADEPSLWIKMTGYTLPASRRIRAGQALYAAIRRHVERPEFMLTLGVPNTFHGWYRATNLHIWLLLVRMRSEGSDGKALGQLIFDTHFEDMDNNLRKAGLTSQMDVGKTLKTILPEFYGMCVGFDTGLHSSDVVLANAVWRNFFSQSEEEAEAAASAATPFFGGGGEKTDLAGVQAALHASGNNSAQQVGRMVEYIRHMNCVLANQDAEDIMEGIVTWDLADLAQEKK